MSSVSFASEQTDFIVSNQENLTNWFIEVCKCEAKTLGDLAYIFCSDDYLLGMNKQFLSHDYYTDVITFDYTDTETTSGDVFISIDRVRENAETASQTIDNELHRVMVHGLLHLLGYGDKSPTEKTLMTSKEDFYLSLRAF
ncbi:MAG: rRNA maturation RNase YbeY [Flavobacteriales bacterium]